MAVIDSIVKQAGDARKSMDWYRRKVQDATGSGTTARGLIRQGKATAAPKFGIFNLFGYQAKTYGESYGVKYYDKFPLIIPTDQRGARFWGINFHYLPYGLRVQLFRRMLSFASDTNFDKRTRYAINYENNQYFKKTTKHYLFSQVRTSFLNIPADEMAIAIFLPVARFVGGRPY